MAQARGDRWVAVTLAAVAAALVLATAPVARAQSDRFAVNRFYPSTSLTAGFITVDGGWLLPAGSWEIGLLGNVADDLLVVVDEQGNRLHNLVGTQTTLDLLAAIGIVDWLELGLEVPIILAQTGDPFPAEPAFDGSQASAGVGDIRLVTRAQLLATERQERGGGVALSLAFDLWVPSGDQATFQGEGAARFEPSVALEWANASRLRFGLNLGYRIRPTATLADLQVDDTLTWGLASEIPLGDLVALDVEVAGELAVLAGSTAEEETPIEALLALEVVPIDGLRFIGGAGTGLVDGVGAPDLRLFLGVALAHLTEPLRDRDGDGQKDAVDACPDRAEDYDGFEDDDGCPEEDNDNDGQVDALDDCPLEAEDIDGHMDGDGCPDPDNDWDFINDDVDPCPNEAEDFDRFEDEDGCADYDNDEDGIPDTADECPDAPESFNDFEDEDGCWDEEHVAVEPCQAINIADYVYFEVNSATIQPRSHDLLDQVGRTMAANRDITLLRVEGHTDNRGDEQLNLSLSQRRAEAVLEFLVEFGVARDRLLAEGFGEGFPIADNRTSEGRQRNRRVEFIILEQEGCE